MGKVSDSDHDRHTPWNAIERMRISVRLEFTKSKSFSGL